MNYGLHSVPEPLQDEDKWAKLTIRQWGIMIPAILLSLVLLTVTWKLHIFPLGISLAVILVALAICIAWIELPDDKYLFGSRVKLEKLLLRLLWKKMPFNKKIYVKNYDNGYREWFEK